MHYTVDAKLKTVKILRITYLRERALDFRSNLLYNSINRAHVINVYAHPPVIYLLPSVIERREVDCAIDPRRTLPPLK